ncbi:MAG: Bro-N domain-containing protein [Saprospiraceae bacterium]|nr:Bro-N domain-containing protein [Saprospiraceae bacterium]
MSNNNQIILFEEKQIRRVWYKEEWWFVVEDIIGLLTDSKNPKKYLAALRSRDKELAKGYPQLVDTLAVHTEGGKQRMTCSNRKGILRIIMSVPSPKAEPFKLWLAQVGEERMEEIENPELALSRMRELYLAKGYPTEWVETRMRSIDIRKQLTDEWKARQVKEGTEYAILTAEIAKATFDLTPSEHKQFKGLEKENLRDHMTNLELIFTMLGEEATRHIAVQENAQGFEENRDAAIQGGRLAGKARHNVEEDKRFKVVSSENFLHLKKIEIEEQKDTEDKTN